MFGITIIVISILFIITFIWSIKDNNLVTFTCTAFMGFILFLCVGGLVSKIQASKSKVETYRVLQTNIEYQRLNDFSEFERLQILEDINKANEQIAEWKTRGEHWWDNKWLYHSSTKTIEYLH